MKDLIKRDDAIALLLKWADGYSHIETPTADAVREFEALPSAQKTQLSTEDTTFDCISRQAAIDAISCDITVTGRQNAELVAATIGTFADRIKALPSAQPEQQWIPCSERLPEESGRYLVSVLDGVGRRTTVAPYQPRYKAWTMTGRMAYWKVIAWMPLPESYRGANE